MILGGLSAEAGNIKVDLNINLDPLRPIIVREEVYRPQVPVRYDFEREHPQRDEVQFIYPEELGFYVAVGVPYELYYIGRSYYLYNDGRWLRAHSRQGPWVAMSSRNLPKVLRQHRIERISDYRQHGGYASYRTQERYRDRNQQSDRKWKGERG